MENRKQVLITGATGFIGGAIARRWAALGMGRQGEVSVRAMVRDPASENARRLAEAGVELVQGDLSEPGTFLKALEGCEIVVHAAAETTATNPRQAWKTGVEATRKLYDAAAETGLRRFLFISSMMVYGGSQIEGGEDQPVASFGDVYSDAKIEAEKSLVQSNDSPGCPQVVILRLAPVYGPGSARWTKEPINRAIHKRLSVPGAGDFPFLYLYVDNMVDAVTAAALSGPGGVYNIYDGVTTYREFMRYYTEMAHSRLRSTPVAVMMGAAAVNELAWMALGRTPQNNRTALQSMMSKTIPLSLRPEKAMRELGWHPRVSLEEGMAMIERSNGFHKPRIEEPDPWKENDGWKEEDS